MQIRLEPLPDVFYQRRHRGNYCEAKYKCCPARRHSTSQVGEIPHIWINKRMSAHWRRMWSLVLNRLVDGQKISWHLFYCPSIQFTHEAKKKKKKLNICFLFVFLYDCKFSKFWVLYKQFEDFTISSENLWLFLIFHYFINLHFYDYLWKNEEINGHRQKNHSL